MRVDTESLPDASLLPLELDALGRREGMTVSRLRNAIPAKCFRIDERRAWTTFGRCIGMVALFGMALAAVEPSTGPALVLQVPLLLFLWLLQACSLVGLFVLGHDCGHGAFSRRRWVNAVVGHLCMAPLLTGFRSWQLAHNHHHAHAQARGRDTDWPEGMVTWEEYRRLDPLRRLRVRVGYGSAAGLLLGFWSGVVRRALLPRAYPQMRLCRRQVAESLLSTMASFTVCALLVGTLWRWGGWWLVVKQYGVPVLVGAMLGALLTLLHHSAPDSMVYDPKAWTQLRGQVISTFDVRFPPVLEWLWLDINRHLPHHLAPRIPWYYLRPATEAIRRAHPHYHQERLFRWRDLRVMWERPLLGRVEESGVYVPAAWDAVDRCTHLRADLPGGRG